MPYKTWAPFERLLSDDMNTYLSEQVPAIFASASARDLAIPAPITGQPAYITDLRALTVWNGSAWKIAAIAGGCAATLEASATQSIPNSTGATVALPTVVEDTHGFALGGNALTVPAGLGGLYQLSAQLFWASQTTVVGFRNLEIKVGAVTAVRLIASQGTASIACIQAAAGVKRLAVGDVVTLFASHTHGSAINSANDQLYAPRLSIVRMGD